jgi:hypothetical protein
MLRTMLFSVVVLAAMVALGSAVQQGGASPKPPASEEAVFTGKVLAVTVKEPANGAVMQKARIKRLGGRAFLVGESVKRSDNDEYPETTFWFPVEDVLLIREFKNSEDLKKARAEDEKQGL